MGSVQPSGRPQRDVKRTSAAELLRGTDSDDLGASSSGKRHRSGQHQRVRVWWPPTDDKSRTGFSGAFWPAAVTARGKAHFSVRYDNGDEERVHCENVFPYEVPLDFGQEIEELMVGEFVEVSNGSQTDPCAWLGCVKEVSSSGYLVRYPFHDAPDERIARPMIRRARIWDGDDWKFVEPRQTWKDGEVASPKELSLLDERAYLRAYLSQPKILNGQAADGGGGGGGGGGNKRKGVARRGA